MMLAGVEGDEQLDRQRRLYFFIKFFGQVSQNIFLAALFVIAGTGQNAAMGLSSLFIAQIVPALLFGMLGGAIADRSGAARGLVIGQALRGATLLGAVFLVGGPASAIICNAVYSAVSQILSPSELALVRTIQREAPARAHSWSVGLQYGGQGVGALLLAPALYWIGGPQLMLIGSFAGFSVLSVLSLLLARSLRGTPACEMQPARQAFAFGETLRFFAEEPSARYAVATMALKTTVARGVFVAMPIYIQKDLQLSGPALGYLFVPALAGVAAGLAWAARGKTPQGATEVMRLAVIGMVGAVFALAVLDYGLAAVGDFSFRGPIAYLQPSLNSTLAVAMPSAFLIGLSLTASLVATRVALTGTAPAGQQSRVFAVQESLTESLLVLPLLLTGVGTAVVGARATLVAIGIVGVLAFALLELPRLRGRAGVPARVVPELAPEALA